MIPYDKVNLAVCAISLLGMSLALLLLAHNNQKNTPSPEEVAPLCESRGGQLMRVVGEMKFACIIFDKVISVSALTNEAEDDA